MTGSVNARIRNADNAASFIYVMYSPDLPQVKIGRSTAPERRLMECQTGCPATLVLEATFRGGEAAERLIHADLKAAGLHVRGEWFTHGPDAIRIWRTHEERAAAAWEARAPSIRRLHQAAAYERLQASLDAEEGNKLPDAHVA